MKKIISLLIVSLLIVFLIAGCSSTIKDAKPPEKNSEEHVRVESSNCLSCGDKQTHNNPDVKPISGTVMSVQGTVVTVNASGKQVKIDLYSLAEKVQKGDFIRVQNINESPQIYVTHEGYKKEVDKKYDVFGILKEAADKYIIININGKNETYKISEKTLIQLLNFENEKSRFVVYHKELLIPETWVRVLVDRSGTAINIVY
ncbi:MAG: hypothetical protein ACPLSX_04175 [Arcobacter sp.]